MIGEFRPMNGQTLTAQGSEPRGQLRNRLRSQRQGSQLPSQQQCSQLHN